MKTLIDLFEKFGKEGKRVALVYRTGVRRFEFTYGELDLLSRKMAQWLATKGINPGDRVILWAPNSPWWAVAFWGIITRGAIVVPVDFISGKERALATKKASGSELIIQSQYKLEKINDDRAFFIEDLEYILAPLKPIEHFPAKNENDIAELVFTSGTTGDPKGVILTHKNLVTNLHQVEQHIQFDSAYNFLSVLPLSHMFEQMGGFLSPLHKGSRIIYLRTLKPSALMEALKEENIYMLVLVPRLLQALKNSIERKFESKHLGKIFRGLLVFSFQLPQSLKKILFFPVRKSFGSNFKFFVSGGASLDPELFVFWKNMGFAVLEGYGLSECSPILTANSAERQVPGSVGIALNGIEIKINHDEILAKGDNIFSGYWENESATRAAFTPDGWFKTGDLGFFDENKNLFIKGRSKDVIVTGAGINVYPEEVEQELNKVEGVLESCIIGLNTGEGEEVHAVLLLKPDAESPEKIIEKVNAKLDPTQQITGFTVWPKLDFPKTPTLKIQKFKVKELIQTRKIESKGSEVDFLIRLIANVTAKDPKEIKENSVLVADLGLTSIGRLELVGFIEQEFRADLDDTVITQKTTVADVRQLIRQRKKVEFKDRLRPWTNSGWVRFVRRVADTLWHRPIFNHIVNLEIRGLGNLSSLAGPVLFVSNHTSYIDGPAIWFALPSRFRYYFATAAGDEFFFQPGGGSLTKVVRQLMYEYLSFFGNIFILPEKDGFRHAVEFMGKLIDRGISVLYFPEGGLQRFDKALPYQFGIGLIIQELKVPVVPIKLSGLDKIIAPDSIKVKKNNASVTFGNPLFFSRKQSSEIVEQVEMAIKSL